MNEINAHFTIKKEKFDKWIRDHYIRDGKLFLPLSVLRRSYKGLKGLDVDKESARKLIKWQLNLIEQEILENRILPIQ